jgi:OOP family OmpA-OmpF porin
MTPTTTSSRLAPLATIAAVVLLASGCAPADESLPRSSPSASAGAGDDLPTVPGYDLGEFPPIPLLALPDISMIDESQSALSTQLQTAIGDFPGLTVTNTQCDENGTARSSAAGSLLLYGDGAGSYAGADGSQQNHGDGSGSYSIGGVDVVNNGDGSGSYTNGTVSIVNNGDGSGTYTDAEVTLQVDGDGSGSYVSGDVKQTLDGDGSGTYIDGPVIIQNNGDGSGSYSDDERDLVIENHGDSTGTVNGVKVKVKPIEAVQSLGTFPTMASLQPLRVCGTTISLSDSVLFDFDASVLRPDASRVLDSLAAALTAADVATATIGGHTDAVGADAYNQTLSEERAAAVVAALGERSVSTALDSTGYGESRPVAPNEVDGLDNPAGRQLNRRVEITIPTQ